MLVFFKKNIYEYYFEHVQTLGTALDRGAQADARGATQVLDRGGQAVARGSCLSQVLGRSAQAAVSRCPRRRSLRVSGT
jgi:hypothetical protein